MSCSGCDRNVRAGWSGKRGFTKAHAHDNAGKGSYPSRGVLHVQVFASIFPDICKRDSFRHPGGDTVGNESTMRRRAAGEVRTLARSLLAVPGSARPRCAAAATLSSMACDMTAAFQVPGTLATTRPPTFHRICHDMMLKIKINVK
jgi:hypothetical protein